MKFINELREGDMVESIYLVKDKKERITQNGKDYFDLNLIDKTGTINAKIWDIAGVAHFEAKDYVIITAQVTSYMGTLQLNIKKLNIAKEGTYNITDYVKASKKDILQMTNDLNELILSVQNTYLKELLNKFFNDTDFMDRFCKHSAAKTMHHDFAGGLLEHSLSVAKICNFLSTMYPVADRDLVITAALFHDIGKVHELSAMPENDYTDIGKLMGHIFMGANMVREKAMEIDNFPNKLLTDITHCILAHHGELEFGSPVTPKTLEALLLSYADNTDAKARCFECSIEDESLDESGWTGYNKMFGGAIRGPLS